MMNVALRMMNFVFEMMKLIQTQEHISGGRGRSFVTTRGSFGAFFILKMTGFLY